jgi:hypothetical protein
MRPLKREFGLNNRFNCPLPMLFTYIFLANQKVHIRIFWRFKLLRKINNRVSLPRRLPLKPHFKVNKINHKNPIAIFNIKFNIYRLSLYES